jgi:hypothetical protein
VAVLPRQSLSREPVVAGKGRYTFVVSFPIEFLFSIALDDDLEISLLEQNLDMT